MGLCCLHSNGVCWDLHGLTPADMEASPHSLFGLIFTRNGASNADDPAKQVQFKSYDSSSIIKLVTKMIMSKSEKVV